MRIKGHFSLFLACYEEKDEKELIDNLDIAQFYQNYDEQKALKLHLNILKILEENFEGGDFEEKDMADTFFEIGVFLENSKSLKNLAKDYFMKALKIREKILGKNDPLT